MTERFNLSLFLYIEQSFHVANVGLLFDKYIDWCPIRSLGLGTTHGVRHLNRSINKKYIYLRSLHIRNKASDANKRLKYANDLRREYCVENSQSD